MAELAIMTCSVCVCVYCRKGENNLESKRVKTE